MPAEPSTKTNTSAASRKRSLTSKRGAIACVRCKERKAKCVPAPPGTSNVPTCTNCFTAKAECIYLERTPNELFLLEYVTQLEARVAALEIELTKYTSTSEYTTDHSQTQAAAVDALTKQFPPGTWPSADGKTATTIEGGVVGGNSKEISWQHLTLAESSPPEGKTEGGQEEEETDLARGIGMLSLSGSGEPVFVGGSSGVNWARICSTALRRPDSQATQLARFNYFPPPETSSIDTALSYNMHHPVPPLPPAKLANRYLEVAFHHIQARYGFLDWPTIRNWHENREEICLNRPLWGVGRGEDYRRSMAAFFLWMIYGYGAILTQDENLEGSVPHEIYHNIAVACLSNVFSRHSLVTVQAELLLTIYSIRHAHPEISVWQCHGLALRTAIQIGLHRRTRSRAEREKDPVRYEIKKRVFWAVYTLDRMLALQLGRPSGIQDRDIDVELPLNIDVDYTDPKEIFGMQNKQLESMGMINNGGGGGGGHHYHQFSGDEYLNGYDSLTSMTSCIHNIRLNQLKQLIQDANYRVDMPIRKPSDSPNVNLGQEDIPEVDELLVKLGQWRACHPAIPPGRSGVPIQTRQQFDLEYHNAVQMLLRPVSTIAYAAKKYHITCADSAAAFCEIQFSFLLQSSSPSYHLNNWALYRLFLSGLTLLHLASPPCIYLDTTRAESALQKCSESLKCYARSLPGTAAYADCFKELIEAWKKQMTSMAVANISSPVLLPSMGIGVGQSHIPGFSSSPHGSQSGNNGGNSGDLQAFARWMEQNQLTQQPSGQQISSSSSTTPSIYTSSQLPQVKTEPGLTRLPPNISNGLGVGIGVGGGNRTVNTSPTSQTLAQFANSGYFNLPNPGNTNTTILSQPSSATPQSRSSNLTPSTTPTVPIPNYSSNSGHYQTQTQTQTMTSQQNLNHITIPQNQNQNQTQRDIFAAQGSMSLLGSPTAAGAFTDQWAGKLGEMGGRLGGGMRDDFFSLLNSLGVDTSIGELAPIAEEPLATASTWSTNYFDHNNNTINNHNYNHTDNSDINDHGNSNDQDQHNMPDLMQYDWTADLSGVQDDAMGDEGIWRFPFN